MDGLRAAYLARAAESRMDFSFSRARRVRPIACWAALIHSLELAAS
jgi:hypothetical protein